MKAITRTLIIGISIVCMCGTNVFALTVPSDVKYTPYEKAVTKLVEKEIITGDTDGKYHSEENLTRAQSCILIVKAMKAPMHLIVGTATQNPKSSGFSDMAGYHWAEGYISYGVRTNITKGYPNGAFMPGQKVTSNELITMVLRAAGYTDDKLGGTWPENYIAKGKEKNIGEGLLEELPEYATKGMAAQMIYNLLEEIETANSLDEGGKNSSKAEEKASVIRENLIYTKGKFNENLTEFGGIDLDKNVKVLAYGIEKEYTDQMLISNKNQEFIETNLYRYKGVETAGWYKEKNGKIVQLIIPKDVGFSGRAYAVITGTNDVLDSSDKRVKGLSTLTAGHEITWPCQDSVLIPSKSEYEKGLFYELNVKNGEVDKISKSLSSDKVAKVFEGITPNEEFKKVESYQDGVVTIEGNAYSVKNNATVYILENGKYSQGKLSYMKKDVQVRLLDISDDKEKNVDLVIIKK